MKPTHKRLDYFGTDEGNCVSFTNPLSDQISVGDIITSLSRQRRGLGHDATTIAQHLLITAYLTLEKIETLPPEQRRMAPLYAILHDAHEAYIGDIPMPLKTTLRERWNALAPGTIDPIAEIEAKLDGAIHAAFGLAESPPPETKKLIKACDQDCMALEMRDAMSAQRRQTFLDSGYKFPEPRGDIKMEILHPREVEGYFAAMIDLLCRAAKRSQDDFEGDTSTIQKFLFHFSGLKTTQGSVQQVRPYAPA